MDQLNDKAQVDLTRIKREISKTVAYNLSKLSEPCYYPEVKKHYYQLLHFSKLTEKDIKDFTKRTWKGRPEAKWNLHQDSISMFYIYLMHVALKNKDQTLFQYLMVFYFIRIYANLLYKHLKHYCEPSHFKWALDVLTKTHLFSREKTISNALYYLALETVRKYQKDILEWNVDNIAKFITASRHRMSQSMKSFAETYYKASKEGKGIGVEPEKDDSNEYQYQSLEKTNRVINDLVKKITVYRFVDQKARDDAKKLTKINSTLANNIVNNLTNVKYNDDLRTIYTLFVKDITMNIVCRKEFYNYVKNLMSLKRTRQNIYFKQQINILLLKILDDLKYKKEYNQLTPQTMFLINLFFAYYLTILFRNVLC